MAHTAPLNQHRWLPQEAADGKVPKGNGGKTLARLPRLVGNALSLEAGWLGL